MCQYEKSVILTEEYIVTQVDEPYRFLKALALSMYI